MRVYSACCVAVTILVVSLVDVEMKRDPVTEGDVKELVKAWFKARGGWSYAPIQNGLGEHGIHDRVGCIPLVITQAMVGKRIGLTVTVESKEPGRRNEERRGMSKHQQLQMEAALAAGGFSICCDGGEDLERLDYNLDRFQHA